MCLWLLNVRDLGVYERNYQHKYSRSHIIIQGGLMGLKFAENGQGRSTWSWDHWGQPAGGVKMVMAQWKERRSPSRSTRRERRGKRKEKTLVLKERSEACTLRKCLIGGYQSTILSYTNYVMNW